jgi:tetratricopeptide (TPR) repeat protein
MEPDVMDLDVIDLGRYLPMIDGDILALGGIAVAVVVFWLLIRKGAGGTAAQLRAAYKKIVKADVPEWRRPYALLATRERWHRLPEDFLMELASRLMDKDNVIEFIVLAERHGLHRERLPGLAGYESEWAMRAVSNALAELADGARGSTAKSARSLAVMVDPDNPKAAIALAADYYGAKRFADALGLLERALPLCEQAVEAAQQRGALPGDTAEQSEERHGELYAMFERAVDMYEDCVERV